MGLEYLNLKRLFRAKFEAHVFSVFSTIQEITRPVEKLRQPLQSLKSQLNSQARTCVQQVLFLARLQVHQTVEVRCSCAEFKLCWREIADTTNDALFSGSFCKRNQIQIFFPHFSIWAGLFALQHALTAKLKYSFGSSYSNPRGGCSPRGLRAAVRSPSLVCGTPTWYARLRSYPSFSTSIIFWASLFRWKLRFVFATNLVLFSQLPSSRTSSTLNQLLHTWYQQLMQLFLKLLFVGNFL